jgi:aspartyl-tRNA(Asn)/glutamyl-tRNA(Gln) amidotransferase subunit C
MQLEEIKKLALMARIDMSEEEMAEIAGSFDAILAYVGHVQEVQGLDDVAATYRLENVMREDIITNTPGEWTEKIIAQMPDSQDGFLKVKQIL